MNELVWGLGTWDRRNILRVKKIIEMDSADGPLYCMLGDQNTCGLGGNYILIQYRSKLILNNI